MSSARRTCRAVLLFAAVSLLAPYAARAQSGAEERAAPIDAVAALEQRFGAALDRIRRKYELPGVTAALALPGGEVIAVAMGLADKESGTPLAIETRMPAGSVGKTFVAAVALGLVHDGRLSLDDTVQRWLGAEPWFAELPNGRDLTVRHLLMHRGGLVDHVNDLRFMLRVRRLVQEGDADFTFRPAELVGFVLRGKPLFAAGEGYAYTDTGYVLVGMIIERAGGAAYYDQLRDRFLEPLHLERTQPADRRDLADVAAGYLEPGNALGLPEKTLVDGQLAFNPANEWTGGGLISTPHDLVRWAQALYGGRALNKPYVEELINPGPADQPNPGPYGLGVFVAREEARLRYFHGGWFPGYQTLMEYYPAQRVAVAFQTNTDVRSDMLPAIHALVQEVLATVGEPPAAADQRGEAGEAEGPERADEASSANLSNQIDEAEVSDTAAP